MDDYLAIAHKPPGWLVHRTALDRGESRVMLQAVRDALGRPVWPVHRLDKGTSGLLVFALDAQVAAWLSARFESGEGLRKTYLAVLRGWTPPQLHIDHALRRMADDRRAGRTEVQSAQTTLHTLAQGTLPVPQPPPAQLRWSLLQMPPPTGRRHQLRRHAKHIAHPMLGDATHGKGPLNRALAEHLGLQRLWLHAWQLRLPHPISGATLTLCAPPDASWGTWGPIPVSLPHEPAL